jgi:hypothetical protein
MDFGESEWNGAWVTELLYAVLGEAKEYDKPLFSHSMSLKALMVDIVGPYESGDAFRLDGVPVTKDTLTRLKVVKQGSGLTFSIDKCGRYLHRGKQSKLSRDAYWDRIDMHFRQCPDVTNLLVQAYVDRFKPEVDKVDDALEKAGLIAVIAEKVGPVIAGLLAAALSS